MLLDKSFFVTTMKQIKIMNGLRGFGRLELTTKMQLIGSTLLILSLFLNWYSDTDVFRSGDVYTGLSGPLNFIGWNLMLVAVLNICLTLAKNVKLGFTRKFTEVGLGKLQMIFGFSAMYLLIIVNAIYFNPQFGLNILSKRSEIGVMLAMVSTVMICVGGYLAFRKKFDIEQVEESVEPRGAVPVELPAVMYATATAPVPAHAASSPAAAEIIQENPVVVETAPAYSGGGIREKTDYERTKAYETLKKMMLKDTLTPDQRRREREKGVNENAFSANFGKTGAMGGGAASSGAVRKPVAAEAAVGQPTTQKKTQMYRMDL